MPKDKDLKRLARRRVQKTGESYAAARSQLLKKKSPLPRDYAKLAGMSDAAVRAKTGKTWEGWVRALDAIDAAEMPHREIAEYVYENHEGVSDWWAQTVTVGYERIRGLREIGQRRGGSYEANKSKTLPVPVAELYRAWSDPGRRERWLPGIELEVRKATPRKSLRITWEDGTSVEVYFYAKGDDKSQVTLQQRKLPSKESAEAAKVYWGERLDALAELLIGG